MGYKIDGDTNPPILAASLSAGAGQIMALSITVPSAYYDSHKPIGYVYAQGFGGQVSSISAAADTVILTAHSKAGDNVLSYARVNPAIQNAGSVQSWLSGLCALGGITAQFAGDTAILNSVPYIRQQAVADLMDVLQTIANCYGIDVYHISADTGDVILFAQPGLTAAGSLDGILSALTYTDQDREYEQCVIVRTAPIEQHDKTPLNRERLSLLKQTTHNHPYLEAEVQYNEINRYWDGKITTFSYEELAALDSEVTLKDPAEADAEDEWYRTRFAYSPYFGSWLKTKYERSEDNVYGISITGSPYGGSTTETKTGRLPAVPTDGSPYDHYTESYTQEDRVYFGVFPSDLPYAVATYDYYKDTWYLNPGQDEHGQPLPPHNIEENHTSNVKSWSDLWPDTPAVFFVGEGESHMREADAYNYQLSGSQYTKYKSIDFSLDAEETVTAAYQPAAADYPWLPTVRSVKSVSRTTTPEEALPGQTIQTTTEQKIVTKALFDSDWNDFVKPPTIDENYLETGSLDAVALDKAAAGVWFDAEANPAADRQFAGLGCVQNYKYSLATSQEKIYIRAGHEPGRLTAAWNDNTNLPQYYNLQTGMSLNRIYTGDQTLQLTLISSSSKSFATARANATGKSYTITGSVWQDRETALLCIPYISRIHNHGRSVSANIPAALLSLQDAFGLLGKTKNLRNEAVYISGITADLKQETISLTGYVVVE